MKRLFDEIIKIDTLTVIIKNSEITPEEKEQLLDTVKDTIHYHLVDLILDEIEESARPKFLLDIEEEENYPLVLQKLSKSIKEFEHKVLTKISEIEQDIISKMR